MLLGRRRARRLQWHVLRGSCAAGERPFAIAKPRRYVYNL